MAFEMAITQWPTIKSFANHIAFHRATIDKWANHVVLHHTIKPLVQDWRGEPTVRAMATFYETVRGWRRGPHLYICVGSPEAHNDGIWQLTPLDRPGIHAMSCNPDGIGVEVVGFYDTAQWSVGTRALTLDALAVLIWAVGGDVCSLLGHRDCGSPKTCPGRAINMADVRAHTAYQMITLRASGIIP